MTPRGLVNPGLLTWKLKNLRLKVTELGCGCLVGLAKDVPTGSNRRYSKTIRLWLVSIRFSLTYGHKIPKSLPIVRWCSGWLINLKGRFFCFAYRTSDSGTPEPDARHATMK